MGPKDPFDHEYAPHEASGAEPSYSFEVGPAARDDRAGWLAPAAGLCLGVLFGVLVLVFGFGGALLVLFLGGLGALVGWLGYGMAAGRLDPASAWRALRRQQRDSLR